MNMVGQVSCYHEIEEPWQQFRHPYVRQLAFCVGSPDIISNIPDDLTLKYHFLLHSPTFWQDHFEQYLPRLKQLDQNPEPLIAFLNQLKSTRLGLRFEYLLWFWLLDRDYHAYQLLGHSIQKIKGAKTLGELDFVLLNTQTNQIEHWEVALKYYLGECDLSLSHWYGLNRDDTLHKKLNYFTQRQFQFDSALGHAIEQCFAVMKGQLFVPEKLDPTHMPLWINTQRRLGSWGTQVKAGYYRLQRHEWLCPHESPSSLAATWWTNGLYLDMKHSCHYYMYRQSLMLSQFR